MDGSGNGSMREKVRLGPCPGTVGEPYVPILRADGRGVQRGYFIGDCLLGVVLHWDSLLRRLMPCRRDAHDCVYCRRGLGSQWKGYACAALWPRRCRRIVEVPEGAYRSCAALLAADGRLRGQWFSLKRWPGPTNNAPVTIEIKPGAPVEPQEVPWDTLASLLMLWGLREAERATVASQNLAQRLDDGAADC
jgi:hypothetical protein